LPPEFRWYCTADPGFPVTMYWHPFKKGITKINIGTEIRQAYETNLQTSGKISTAQEAVYERTCWLIAEYFGLKNIQPLFTQGLS